MDWRLVHISVIFYGFRGNIGILGEGKIKPITICEFSIPIPNKIWPNLEINARIIAQIVEQIIHCLMLLSNPL
jgi:hypothetical protein